MNLEALTQTAKTLKEANGIIAELVALVKAQQLEVESLKADICALQDKQGKSSRNSSKPPSSDSPEMHHKRPRKKPPHVRKVLNRDMKNINAV